MVDYSWLMTSIHLAVALNLYPVLDISPTETIEYLGSQEIVFVDVREQHEYQAGHIPGSRLLPYSSGVLEEQWTRLPKNKTILVYCRSGRRSHRALQFLKDRRFDQVINMNGGFLAYSKLKNAEIEFDNNIWENEWCLF